MESVASAIERIKGFAKKSSDRLVNGVTRNCAISSDHDPIEILKRLQREAFSDLMKLRDRQEKTERILSFYKTNKQGPFQEASTNMKGIVDLVGALLFVENDDQSACDAFDAMGLGTGIDLRFIFKTAVRQKDIVLAQFTAGQNNLANHGNVCGSPLTLEKVMYLANINDWLSVIMSPLGAQCTDYGVTSIFEQGWRRGKISSFVPPLFNQLYNCGAGALAKGSNIAVSVAELVSGMQLQPDDPVGRSLNTFGQVTYQPLEEARVTFSCLWQTLRPPNYLFKFGTLAIPMSHWKRRKSSGLQGQATSSATSRKSDDILSGSIALMLDAELDESTNVGGWIQLQKSSTLVQWGAFIADIPEDELGWGVRIGGKTEGHFSQLQLEGFLNFNFGNRFSLQPGLVYAMDGINHTPALMFRSSWFM